ncbi:MAG: DUF3536 domain-containing protein [Elusimicrobiota bacterium]
MKRCICIHGHYYQPPRENPWLEEVERQESAYPYHDWNERIAAECYGPNAKARILDGENRIVRIVNNYSRTNFDFGPTLLSWLKTEAPAVYAAILEAERESRWRFSGHGSAMAQAYSHSILPLASRRDKRTEVRWGVRDFELRFHARPEGLWLPECAVDIETLDILAAEGVRFTVLAPRQARRVRKIGSRPWKDVRGERVDPTMPYLVRLPSGRTISVFFYDGPISRAVAFEALLTRGDHFAERLTDAFARTQSDAQLVHIATDGETYGHHQRFGEMALAYALDRIEATPRVGLSNYGEFLEKHPPTHEAKIVERTSWSCAHGVERWRSDCGCSTGAHPGWRQEWRAPLREALEWLRDRLAETFEKGAAGLLADPWAARDGYVDVVADRSRDKAEAFLSRHASRELAEADKVRALKLLEMQRHALFMFTSCGWFFDDVSGIETAQILQYAARALQLGRDLSAEDLEPEFIERLARAKSSAPGKGDGRRVYEQAVKPAIVDMVKLGAHYGVSELFEETPEQARLQGYSVRQRDPRLLRSGPAKLAIGHATIESKVTRETAEVSYSFLHAGDHELKGGARIFRGPDDYEAMLLELTSCFSDGDIPTATALLDKHFEGSTFSLRSLLRDDQRRIIGRILERTLAETEAAYGRIYKQRAELMRVIAELGVPQPKALRAAAEFALNTRIRRALAAREPDFSKVERLVEEVRGSGVPLDAEGLGYALEPVMERLCDGLRAEPDGIERLDRLDSAARLARVLSPKVDLWKIQNAFYAMLHEVLPGFRDKAGRGDDDAKRWVERFESLGKHLSVRVD